MTQKKMLLKPNANGVDLLIERDSGNKILILMGRSDIALENWKRLRLLAADAIKVLEFQLANP